MVPPSLRPAPENRCSSLRSPAHRLKEGWGAQVGIAKTGGPGGFDYQSNPPQRRVSPLWREGGS